MAIAAGVNAKQLSTYMGHASIAITYDRCGHLMSGDEAEAAGLMDAYLARGSIHDGPVPTSVPPPLGPHPVGYRLEVAQHPGQPPLAPVVLEPGNPLDQLGAPSSS